MNTCVQAGPLTVSFVANLVKANVLTTSCYVGMFTPRETASLYPLNVKLTINGHSVKCITPETVSEVNKAMLIAA